MAFFGLTTLGPQNNFTEHLKARSRLCIFEIAEFEAAFLKLEREQALGLQFSQVVAVLESVYHGPVPRADFELCAKYLPSKDRLSCEEFLTSIRSAQLEEAEWLVQEGQRVSVSSEFSSSMLYREHNTRHKRMIDGPRDKYCQPLTSNMEIGWTEPAKYEQPQAGKNSCEETVYAAELIKSGVYY